MLKFVYKKDNKIKKLLEEIKVVMKVFDALPSLPHIEERLRRESLLKSSLYSARIEGNPLTISQIEISSKRATDISKLEVFNLLTAYKYIYLNKVPNRMTLNYIFKLHKMVMKGISPNIGKIRQEPWGIFNQSGVAVYLAPTHFRLPKLMAEFVTYANSMKYESPVKAAILQFLIEKIHPFADGNGRVGRLVSAYELRRGGYHLKGLVSFEEFIDKNRQEYYRVLEPTADVTSFVEFFLHLYVEQANSVLEKIKDQKEEAPEDSLLPRRREILEIVRDHPYCSFDFISRRFVLVNKKTLHYDLAQLQKQSFIRKIGKTRGSTYISK